MEQKQLLSLLESIKSLSREQVIILYNTLSSLSSLSSLDSLDIEPDESQVLQDAEENFSEVEYCPRCRSDNVGGWGTQSKRPRYKARIAKRHSMP